MDEEVVTADYNEEDELTPFLNDSTIFFEVNNNTIDDEEKEMYMGSFGILLAVPQWEAIVTAVCLSVIIFFTVFGNVLVILSVLYYRPLRSSPPNFFILSLAVADLAVAFLVLPFNVVYSILGRWVLGKIACELWLTSDVTTCTSSILHLCAIALDRYRAITDPVNYARKRTNQRVTITIIVVWIMSFIISSPPLLGWNDWPSEFNENSKCELTTQQGYVIYSALGSFFIPLVVMTAVYIKIFIATRRRLRQRARASRLSAMARQRSSDFGGGVSKKNGQEQQSERERSSVSSVENNNGNEGSNDHILGRNKKEKSGAAGSDNVSSEPLQQQKKCGMRRVQEREGSSKSESELVVNGNDDNENAKNISTNLKGRLKTQLTVDEYDNTAAKLSPARVSDESVTDSEVPLKRANNSGREAHSKSHSNRISKKSNRQPSQQVCQFVEEKQRISLSKERKAARTLGIIMGVFVVSWLPFFLMYVILPFCTICVQPSPKVANFITWLGYVNSSLNPLIYTIFNMDFRKAFKKFLHIG